MNTPIDELLSILSDMATMMEMLDENPFKTRAMQGAVRALEDANFEYLDLEAISGIQGIGKGTLALVREFAETGSIKEYQDLQAIVPASVLEMTRLRGLGAKKVRTLWKDVGISSLDELSAAVGEHRIATAKGFGAKTEANIAEALQQYRSAKEQFHLHKAMLEGERLCGILRSIHGVEECAVAGDAVQGAETVREVSVVAKCAHRPLQEIIAEIRAIAEFAGFEEDSVRQDRHTYKGITANGIPCRIFLAEAGYFGLVQHEVSSAPSFHEAVWLRLSKNLGDRINTTSWDNETELYTALELPFVPPELRIKPTFLDSPDIATILANLATDQQMRGILHVHSTWSDGKHTIRQMAERAQMLGYEYIAICDHSKTAVYAGGLSEERVKEQHEEIDRLNEELRALSPNAIRIMKGIESDILRDGSLDYSDAVLETFDVVVASVHSSFSLDKDTMTDRVCRALEHPATTLLGHPTGRLLNMRKGYELDMEAVLDTAKAHGKAIEINANPYRLDLSAENAALAEAWGVPLAINTDAHNREDVDYMRYGLKVARRAGLKTSSIVNALTLEEFCRKFGIQ
jgi:DNA polymerase (family 10)